MLFQAKDDDGFMSVVADGRLMNAPYIEEVEVSGRRRTRAKFFLKYGFITTLDGKKSSRTICCTVWNEGLIDLCRVMKKNDTVILLGIKVLDKSSSDKYGKPYYNIQVSSMIPQKTLTETLLHYRETKRYEKSITEVYKRSNRENKMSLNYAGEPESKFDADF